LTNLNTQLTNARIAVAEAKARLDRIQRMGGESIMNFIATDVRSNPDTSRALRLNWALSGTEIVRLRTQYRELASKAAEIEAIVGPNHSAVVKLHERTDDLRKSIQEEERRIADAYASEYQIATVRESEIAASKTQSMEEAETSSQAQVTM